MARCLDDVSTPVGTQLPRLATFTVHALRNGADVWLFGVQQGAHPMARELADAVVWLAGLPYTRTTTIVNAPGIDSAIHEARRRILEDVDLLCHRCLDGATAAAAPPPYDGQRWCRPCIDDYTQAA